MLRFDRFVELALYDAEVGYYRQARSRVGYGAGTDFFTASTSGPVFGELIVAAGTSLLGSAAPFTFVEIGAEPGSSILDGVAHPFAGHRTLRLGEPLELSGRCIVFSNELFDAQPFRRFAFRRGGWRELGVILRAETLAEIELDSAPSDPPPLPEHAPDGYIVDTPLAAAALARRLAAQPWSGLFLACDYGKSWPEIIRNCPAGTARAYYRHTQTNDLLARPGEQDLTCHICWDWLIDVLSNHGFESPRLESQEAFFVHHAAGFIAELARAEAGRFSPRKQSLLQLLHPTHLGRKFQVLHAVRL